MDAVILVPGLFGFAEFGQGAERIAYFDQVASTLSGAMGLPTSRILSAKPGPAEPLAWRVRYLYDFVKNVLDGRDPTLGAVDRVHLVGHSTGGVDVRLLVNSGFAWPGAPPAEERRALIARLGGLVSLSGPHWGSPIARRLRGAFEGVLPHLYLASILGKHNRFAWAESLLLAPFVVGEVPAPAALATEMGALPRELSGDVARFLEKIDEDHGLIHDLTPQAMKRLNAAVASGESPRVRYFVTTAPVATPLQVLGAGLRGQPLRAGIYSTAERLTRPAAEDLVDGVLRRFPSGAWVGTDGGSARSEATDGVVPSSSQTLKGEANGVVYGDHLDVVGHYSSQRFRGTTLFLSGASFDDARFDALWTRIARELR